MEPISTIHSGSMNNSSGIQPTAKKQQTTRKLVKKSSSNASNAFKARTRHRLNGKQTIPQPTCTRCGHARLIDITSHEFPKQKGLIFECTSCGNNSIRSNVSAEERRQRLAKIVADHLNTVECHFCHRIFHSHNDYIVHLKDDHQSDKPVKSTKT